jgi:hypothetical protein
MIPDQLFHVDMLARLKLVDILAREYLIESPTYACLSSLFDDPEIRSIVDPDSRDRRFREIFLAESDNMRHSLLEPKFQGPGAGATARSSIWTVE